MLIFKKQTSSKKVLVFMQLKLILRSLRRRWSRRLDADKLHMIRTRSLQEIHFNHRTIIIKNSPSNYSGTVLLQRLRIFVFRERNQVLFLFICLFSASELLRLMSETGGRAKARKKTKQNTKHARWPSFENFSQAHHDGVLLFDRTWSTPGCTVKKISQNLEFHFNWFLFRFAVG